MTGNATETLAPALNIRHWATPEDAHFTDPVFMFDAEALPDDLSNVSVVLPRDGADRARELIARNAAQVLFGDAALKDSGMVAPLAQELGEGRLGLWLPVRRMSVSWSLDTETNADFRCLAPSRVKPAWEVLMADGSATGTDALWWTGQMLARGATTALIAADLTGDPDLNICAELTELYGPQLWLTPRRDADADLRPWLQYGHVRNFVLPQDNEDQIAALAAVLAPPMETAAA